jgi:hypothetical protein
LPFEHLLFPGINIACDYNDDEDEYNYETEQFQLSYLDSPGIEENNQHVKGNEQKGIEIIAEVELHPGTPDGFHTAFVCLAFNLVRLFRYNFKILKYYRKKKNSNGNEG